MGRERKLSNSRNESISKILGINRDRTATNGTGLTATNLVHAMSILTKRTDLHFLTLRPWVKVLSKRGLLRHERAWCPFCYQTKIFRNCNLFSLLSSLLESLCYKQFRTG